MDRANGSKCGEGGIYYDTNYGNFDTEIYSDCRREAFGEDIGQNSWLTADEQDSFLSWLDLSPGKALLDVACGAGGPALRIAANTGALAVGIDVHEQAIATANALAERRGLSQSAKFRVVDAPSNSLFLTARLTQSRASMPSTIFLTGRASLLNGYGC